jgi:plasmid stabilization system protein ParE
MSIQLSELAENSLNEIFDYYIEHAGFHVAEDIEIRILKQITSITGFETAFPKSEVYPETRKLVIMKLPYVAFIRELQSGLWEVVDIIHTSRKLPK